jgi:hypothetical protein
MKTTRSKAPLFFAALAALLAVVSSSLADEWKLTGAGVRVKTVAVVDVNVYAISHFMKELPKTKSKQAVIAADVDKKFVWKMKRDVEHDKITGALKDAFAMNGYGDAGKIAKFISAFRSELKENNGVTIAYDASKKTTTVKVDGQGTAAVEGVDFMKAVWSVWLGKIDQPKLGDQLIAKIP